MSPLSPLTAAEVQTIFTSIFSGPEDAFIPTVQKWFNPEYVQFTDGHGSTYAEFVAHLKKLRSIITKFSFEVLFLIQEDNKIADRHVVTVEKIDGSTAVLEVLLLGERDETGRFLKVWETSRTLKGDESSAELGRLR